jgi:flagellar biogenesis protein FliO
MGNRWIGAIALAMLVVSLSAQEPEFATTAPAKILLPIDESAARSPEAPEANAPAVESGAEADPMIAEIGKQMDEQNAADGEVLSEAAPQVPPDETDSAPSPAKAAGRATVALCGTLVLILLIYAAIKRWGKSTPLLAGQQLARVIGRVGLSPQASLHFIQTNGEVLVIGVTQQQVSLLRTFDASDFATATEAPVEKAPEAALEPAASFLAQLKESRAAMGVEAAVDDDLDQLKGELQRLKQYFQDSTRARD